MVHPHRALIDESTVFLTLEQADIKSADAIIRDIIFFILLHAPYFVSDLKD